MHHAVARLHVRADHRSAVHRHRLRPALLLHAHRQLSALQCLDLLAIFQAARRHRRARRDVVLEQRLQRRLVHRIEQRVEHCLRHRRERRVGRRKHGQRAGAGQRAGEVAGGDGGDEGGEVWGGGGELDDVLLLLTLIPALRRVLAALRAVAVAVAAAVGLGQSAVLVRSAIVRTTGSFLLVGAAAVSHRRVFRTIPVFIVAAYAASQRRHQRLQ